MSKIKSKTNRKFEPVQMTKENGQAIGMIADLCGLSSFQRMIACEVLLDREKFKLFFDGRDDIPELEIEDSCFDPHQAMISGPTICKLFCDRDKLESFGLAIHGKGDLSSFDNMSNARSSLQ